MGQESGREAVREFLAHDSPQTVHQVAVSMGKLMVHLDNSGLGHENDFLGTYHRVTQNIASVLEGTPAYGVKRFKEPEVLHAATSDFYPLFTENILDPKPHWRWMDDERVLSVDMATRGVLGYNSHITGSDLALTVYHLRQSPLFTEEQVSNYIRHDFFPKIDIVLGKTAHEMAPELTKIQNKVLRQTLTNTFMGAVVLGRQVALNDANKLSKASSDDEREFIAQRARYRTAWMNEKLLDFSYKVNNYTDKNEKSPTVIDLERQQPGNAAKLVAKVIGTSLRKAA